MAEIDIASFRRVHAGAPGTETPTPNAIFTGDARILRDLGYF